MIHLRIGESRTSLYCGYLIEVKNRQSSTVRSYISAIKKVLTQDGYEWNDRRLLLNSLTRACKLKKDVIKIRLPISKAFMELMIDDIQRELHEQDILQ